ncbi:Peptidase S54 rhomboid domain [Arabidopsis thaliana x Arabidopsis arenosa]|uniref:Peptidase S54 rhomboid domain n=2 Tax=Arabidopsis TaxID=3701 RepID=A0A8T2BRL8_ARASU|nr:Peptidase S54 rhomboid domain [Arabidopsis thaliana x Arabidopsis arenosa]KAG7590067.1 Peptidase S54 rhomboid domain [Arabidopsis suecica]
MHAIFSRRVVVVGFSSQLTKLVTKQPSQSRHSLSHLLLPSTLSSSSSATRFVPSLLRLEKVHGFFATTLGNTNLKLKFRNVLESRVGFFSSQLPSNGLIESQGFTGFQKRGWKSWINGANGVVFGLIIANVAVFTMWRVSDRLWMLKHFVLTTKSFTSGRIHTLITSGFSNVGTNQFILNMIGLYYFGTRIARTLGPLYLFKLYFAGALGSSVFFLSNHALLATLKGQGVVTIDKSKLPYSQLGADGSVFAIALLDMFLYPKVTTYFGLMLRVPVMGGILFLGLEMLKILEGKNNNISRISVRLMGGVVVAAMAWARIRKGRF